MEMLATTQVSLDNSARDLARTRAIAESEE